MIISETIDLRRQQQPTNGLPIVQSDAIICSNNDLIGHRKLSLGNDTSESEAINRKDCVVPYCLPEDSQRAGGVN